MSSKWKFKILEASDYEKFWIMSFLNNGLNPKFVYVV